MLCRIEVLQAVIAHTINKIPQHSTSTPDTPPPTTDSTPPPPPATASCLPIATPTTLATGDETSSESHARESDETALSGRECGRACKRRCRRAESDNVAPLAKGQKSGHPLPRREVSVGSLSRDSVTRVLGDKENARDLRGVLRLKDREQRRRTERRGERRRHSARGRDGRDRGVPSTSEDTKHRTQIDKRRNCSAVIDSPNVGRRTAESCHRAAEESRITHPSHRQTEDSLHTRPRKIADNTLLSPNSSSPVVDSEEKATCDEIRNSVSPPPHIIITGAAVEGGGGADSVGVAQTANACGGTSDSCEVWSVAVSDCSRAVPISSGRQKDAVCTGDGGEVRESGETSALEEGEICDDESEGKQMETEQNVPLDMDVHDATAPVESTPAPPSADNEEEKTKAVVLFPPPSPGSVAEVELIGKSDCSEAEPPMEFPFQTSPLPPLKPAETSHCHVTDKQNDVTGTQSHVTSKEMPEMSAVPSTEPLPMTSCDTITHTLSLQSTHIPHCGVTSPHHDLSPLTSVDSPSRSPKPMPFVEELEEDTITLFPEMEREEGELSGDDRGTISRSPEFRPKPPSPIEFRPPTPSSSPYKTGAEETRKSVGSFPGKRRLLVTEDEWLRRKRNLEERKDVRKSEQCSAKNRVRFPDLELHRDHTRRRHGPPMSERPCLPPRHWSRGSSRSPPPPLRDRRLRPCNHHPSPPLHLHYRLHRRH